MKTQSDMSNQCNQQRRSFLKLSTLLGVGAASAVLLPTPYAEAVLFGPREYKVSSTRLSMGSFLSITAIHSSRDEAENAIGLAWEEIDRLGRLLSRHDSSTPVSHLNTTGSLHKAPMEVLEVVARSLYLNKQTGGAFDITVKPLVDLVKERFAAGVTPSEADISALLPRVGSEQIRFSAGDISFARQGMGITLDGIAPGYIVDRVSALLTAKGITNHLINCSGDIRTSGTAANGKPWTVAIQDPAKQKAYPEVLTMGGGAISTSGSYEVFYDREKMFHHIVTPRTGHSPRLATSVTVKGVSAMDVDALATGIMVMSPAEGIRFADSQPGCECFVVAQDGSFKKSASWSRIG
ncbi:MAG: FAD:protein FMN transferase [Desulfurivibrio sp.]|nr:FAD:protein FMN transferase [Desulfurivibrio sp.]MBU3935999.1 FAD:protein FMN transferase [Pseudomonadota bacterium]MBU4118987.1 FAD:protein FMN transferase [Pseudomonadota bacterium]